MHCRLQTNVHDNYYSIVRVTELRLVWRDLDEFKNGGISHSVSIAGVKEQFYAFTVSKSNYTILKALGSSGSTVLANTYV